MKWDFFVAKCGQKKEFPIFLKRTTVVGKEMEIDKMEEKKVLKKKKKKKVNKAAKSKFPWGKIVIVIVLLVAIVTGGYIAREYMLTLLCDIFKEYSPFLDNKDADKNFREYMSAICSISDEDIAEKNYKYSLKEYEELTERLLSDNKIICLRPYFSQLGKNRNSVNHGKGDETYKNLESEFDHLYDECINILRNEYITN